MNCVKLTYNVRGPEIESTFQLLLYIYNRHVDMSLYKNRYYYSFLQKFSFEKISRIITWHYNVHVPKQGIWFPTSYVMVFFFCVQWVQRLLLFCCYWWNWLQVLFKLSEKFGTRTKMRPVNWDPNKF
jgi:hypothetical protein